MTSSRMDIQLTVTENVPQNLSVLNCGLEETVNLRGISGDNKLGSNGGNRVRSSSMPLKVVHYLDTLRSEVLEADRSMAALQSDNRFLREKNKELEAKITNLERVRSNSWLSIMF